MKYKFHLHPNSIKSFISPERCWLLRLCSLSLLSCSLNATEMALNNHLEQGKGKPKGGVRGRAPIRNGARGVGPAAPGTAATVRSSPRPPAAGMARAGSSGQGSMHADAPAGAYVPSKFVAIPAYVRRRRSVRVALKCYFSLRQASSFPLGVFSW